MLDAPCYVKSWAKAHNIKLMLGGTFGWQSRKTGVPVPDHASDAWLAGMVRALVRAEGQLRGCGDGHIHVMWEKDVEMNSGHEHAAICRAATPGEVHSC